MLEAPSFSTSAITLPLYVLRSISYLLGLVMKPTSMPVIESGSFISNLRMGMGDLYSKAYISIVPSSLAQRKV